MADVRRRINMAVARFGKMRNIWTAKVLHIRLRMRLYISSVCSILTYGSEAWLMTEEIRRAINGANSRMMSIITGNSPHDEAKDGTRSFDLVRAIRARRLAWLGHILRMAPTRILVQAVGHVYKNRSEVDILTDAPKTQSWEELRSWAEVENQSTFSAAGIEDNSVPPGIACTRTRIQFHSIIIEIYFILFLFQQSLTHVFI